MQILIFIAAILVSIIQSTLLTHAFGFPGFLVSAPISLLLGYYAADTAERFR